MEDLLVFLLVLLGAAFYAVFFVFQLFPRLRNGVAWIIAVTVAFISLQCAWYTSGSITCDFCCQWLMGRVMVHEQGHYLYLVGPQKKVLEEGYQGESLQLMKEQVLLKGKPDQPDTVEGPLYPPTLCLLMWPFSILVPVAAHAVLVFLYTLLAFLTAWLLRDLTRGRLQMGEAALIVTSFPNFYAALSLGQNSALTLAIITAGWALEARGRSFLAGLVWGLLAFKPVFAVALIGVPLLMLRGRMFLGMVVSGAALCLLTLPFCLPPERQCLWSWNEEQEAWEWVPQGDELHLAAQPWLRWWQVGRDAAETYRTDRNWVWLSRDVLSIPRRRMWNGDHLHYHLLLAVHGVEIESKEWNEKYKDVHQAVQAGDWVVGEGEDAVKIPIGGLMVAGIGAITALLWSVTAWRRWRQGQPYGHAPAGPAAAFLLFGALLTTYHFMYYDLLVFALPMALFLSNVHLLGRVGRIVLVVMLGLFTAFSVELASGHGVVRIPFETFFLIVFWAWAGYLTLFARVE